MYAITVEFFFKVKNGDLYGGEGSEGYARIALDGIYPLANTHEEFEAQGKKLINEIAATTGAKPEDIELITEEEYSAATEEDEDFDGEDEDY